MDDLLLVGKSMHHADAFMHRVVILFCPRAYSAANIEYSNLPISRPCSIGTFHVFLYNDAFLRVSFAHASEI